MMQTKRLYWRPIKAEDFPFFYEMAINPNLMRYIRPIELDPEPTRQRFEKTLQYGQENEGLGGFMVYLRGTDTLIGNCILREAEYQKGTPLEIGYVLFEAFWGQGYATEIVHGLCQHVQDLFQVKILTAFTDEENGASNRVLEKCGFQRAGMEFIYGYDCVKWVHHF